MSQRIRYYSQSHVFTNQKVQNSNPGKWPEVRVLPSPPTASDLEEESVQESFVLLLVTGGTLCMVKNEAGTYIPKPFYLSTSISDISLLHDKVYYEEHLKSRVQNDLTFVLPLMHDNDGRSKRVVYSIYEYNPLIDSSNMTYLEYRQLATDIKSAYDKYDGFVIVHGTDTMAYSSAALSFILEDLGKPVVFTGAQKPMAEMRSDAIDNLQGALVLAGTVIIPEVGVYFNRRLFRGNRVVKYETQDYNAFRSFNMEPLVKMGTQINVNWDAVWRSNKPNKFSISNGWNQNVALLRLFPSITATTVRSFLQPPIRGVVMQTYGAGNGPSNRDDIIREVRIACSRGVLILNISQCHSGSVSGAYEAGAALGDAGVILGADLTPEAALAKLSYVLSLEGLTNQQRRALMETNLRGELTQPDLERLSLSNSGFLSTVAAAMRASSEAEMKQIKSSLYPSLMCSAAKNGDIESIKMLRSEGGDFSISDYNGRTPLHIAAAEGHQLLVEVMLQEGAPVHCRDKYGNTPLSEAVHNKHFEVIELLKNAGATCKQGQYHVANELCTLSMINDLDGLTAWHVAGVELDTPNYDTRTALHIAVAEGHEDIVRFLISQGCDPESVDRFGRSPLDEINDENQNLMELLEWGLSLKSENIVDNNNKN